MSKAKVKRTYTKRDTEFWNKAGGVTGRTLKGNCRKSLPPVVGGIGTSNLASPSEFESQPAKSGRVEGECLTESIRVGENSVRRPEPTPIEREEPIKVNLIPFYNPEIHKAGDVVRQWVGGQLVTLTLPELDAEGHPLETGSIGRLVVAEVNTKRPKFHKFGKNEQIRKTK